MPDPLKLMAVVAHPDDETLGLGGTLARYASEGVETHVVTATHGQRGRYGEHRSGPGHPGPERLAAIREAELRAAAAALGVREVSLLGFVDGQLDRTDPAEVIGRIVAEVRRVRPHVVVTFAHDGAYGHPDHVAISQLTTAALVAAADPGHRGPSERAAPHAVSKLYWMAWPRATWDAYEAALKTLVSVVDGVERRVVPWPEWAITTVIDARTQWERVWEAVSHHASQMSVYRKLHGLAPEHHEALWGWQYFYRVFSVVNGGRGRETDLFEGLRR